MSTPQNDETKSLSNQESTTLTTANQDQLQSRDRLWQAFKSSTLSEAELERSLALFVRGSLLSRILAITEVYKEIVSIPGSVFDFGTWYGQNAVLSENLRAIYEPFNKQRRIFCFDTFEGYANWTEKDRKSQNYHENTYATDKGYAQILKDLLAIHEGNNALGHITGRHDVIQGDATVTVPRFFEMHPGTIVALAFFDLGLYEPTKTVLETIKRHLVPGSILLCLQLTRDELVGDAIAFLEVFQDTKYEIKKSTLYPSFNIVRILGN